MSGKNVEASMKAAEASKQESGNLKSSRGSKFDQRSETSEDKYTIDRKTRGPGIDYSRRDSIATDSGTSTPHDNEEGILLPGRKRPVPLSAVNLKDRSGRTLIYKYASRGDIETTEILLKAGSNLRISDNAGWTPLHEACLEGHVEIVQLMLSYDADVNAVGGDGDTPLHDAIGNCHVHVVEVLLKFGASLTLVNEHGQTPIEFATERLEEVLTEEVVLAE